MGRPRTLRENELTSPISRSRRKHSIASVTAAASGKQDKRDANHALRTATHQKLGTASEETVFPLMREISDVWNTAKEGKRYFKATGDPKRMRK